MFHNVCRPGRRVGLQLCALIHSSSLVSAQDSFIVVFSLSSGHVLYASEQAPSILCCKRKFLESAKFVELLFHQDVNVFYSHTAQPHLPPWSNSHTGMPLTEFSFYRFSFSDFFVRMFCRDGYRAPVLKEPRGNIVQDCSIIKI